MKSRKSRKYKANPTVALFTAEEPLYHGTNITTLPKILKEGLKPATEVGYSVNRTKTKSGIFVTPELQTAAFYSLVSGKR